MAGLDNIISDLTTLLDQTKLEKGIGQAQKYKAHFEKKMKVISKQMNLVNQEIEGKKKQVNETEKKISKVKEQQRLITQTLIENTETLQKIRQHLTSILHILGIDKPS